MPTLVSVTVIDPEGESVPVQPSPEFPPDATQESAFVELQLSEMAAPGESVESVVDKVTPGVATAGDDGGGSAVY